MTASEFSLDFLESMLFGVTIGPRAAQAEEETDLLDVVTFKIAEVLF